jgi:uncharacterized integral membrane protein
MSQTKLVSTLIATAALLIIAFQNRAPVRTRFLVFAIDLPQIVLLLITAGLGFILGLVSASRSASGGKAQAGYQR